MSKRSLSNANRLPAQRRWLKRVVLAAGMLLAADASLLAALFLGQPGAATLAAFVGLGAGVVLLSAGALLATKREPARLTPRREERARDYARRGLLLIPLAALLLLPATLEFPTFVGWRAATLWFAGLCATICLALLAFHLGRLCDRLQRHEDWHSVGWFAFLVMVTGMGTSLLVVWLAYYVPSSALAYGQMPPALCFIGAAAVAVLICAVWFAVVLIRIISAAVERLGMASPSDESR